MEEVCDFIIFFIDNHLGKTTGNDGKPPIYIIYSISRVNVFEKNGRRSKHCVGFYTFTLRIAQFDLMISLRNNRQDTREKMRGETGFQHNLL